MEALSKLSVRKDKSRRLSSSLAPFSVRINAFKFTLTLFSLLAAAFFALSYMNSTYVEPVRKIILDAFSPLLQLNKYHTQPDAQQSDQPVEQQEKEAFWYTVAARLKEENKLLKQALKFRPDPQIHIASAYVINAQLQPLNHLVTIDAGSTSHVGLKNCVVTKEGFVGRIVRMGGYSAQLVPITSRESRLPVRVGDIDEKCIAQGRNKNLLKLKYVKKPQLLKVGQEVLTTADDEVVPNILVGHVHEIKGSKIYIKTAVNFRQLTLVYVLSPESLDSHDDS